MLLKEKYLHNMLIITQVFLKMNSLFLLCVFKEELSSGQRPPEEQDCLRKKGVVPDDGKLEAQDWQGWSPFP